MKSNPAKANIRHDIEQDLVSLSVNCKIAELEQHRVTAKVAAVKNREGYAKQPKQFARAPWSDKEINAYYNECVEKELSYYATVRVIELAATGRYVLVYGDQPDAEVTEGTGPFETFHKAQKWFIGGGR